MYQAQVLLLGFSKLFSMLEIPIVHSVSWMINLEEVHVAVRS
jgi:hypothetical protein